MQTQIQQPQNQNKNNQQSTHQLEITEHLQTLNITSQSDPQMISTKLHHILSRIQTIKQLNKITYPVRLVAVSKTKTVQQIKQAYDAGQRHFGENYVDQIQDKHLKLPNDIKWHFIGHLQSNKIKKVIVPNLFVIETLDRQSLAQKIQKHLVKQSPERILNIYIQVKTSQQESKSGCQIEKLDELYEFIVKKCPNLKFMGLMTIGKEGDMAVFETMYNLKIKMCEKYKLKEQDFDLSMGMSADFQEAIKHHSTSVRVGSSIFGARNYPHKGKVQQVKL